MWEGASRAIAASESHKRTPSPVESVQNAPEAEDVDGTNSNNEVQPSESCDPAALLREVSKRSDLERLSHLLGIGKIHSACHDTFAAALRDGNPAVVEMILNHGKERDGAFVKTFHDWCVKRDGEGANLNLCRPLHMACHAGSPQVVSVLLGFVRECYSPQDRADIIYARDTQGRTALHIASWSPRPVCPGARHSTIRFIHQGTYMLTQ